MTSEQAPATLPTPCAGDEFPGTSHAAYGPSVAADLTEPTQLGEVYVAGLMRAQLRSSASILLVGALLLGAIPAILAMAGHARRARGPFPLPWLVLGVAAFICGRRRGRFGAREREPRGGLRRRRHEVMTSPRALRRDHPRVPGDARGRDLWAADLARDLGLLCRGPDGDAVAQCERDQWRIPPPRPSSALPGCSYERGLDMLWFPVGYTMGYLVLPVLVAAPCGVRGLHARGLAELRLESRRASGPCARSSSSASAGSISSAVPGRRPRIAAGHRVADVGGGLVVGVVVTIAVSAGGMRSITLVQAMQYWIKNHRHRRARLHPVAAWRSSHPVLPVDASLWTRPAPGPVTASMRPYSTPGPVPGHHGSPHVPSASPTNPDGRTPAGPFVVVLGLLGVFMSSPPVYARVWPGLPRPDSGRHLA